MAMAYRARVKVRYTRNYPPTVNADWETEICASVLNRMVGDVNVVRVPRAMGAEDFSFMLKSKPGCYVLAGAGPAKDGGGLHNPLYDFNDEILPIGAAYWASLAEYVLDAGLETEETPPAAFDRAK